MNERQELHCHNCNHYVQFDIDLSLDGNHVLECPNCGHEHCRVVKDGVITGERWDRRNGPKIPVYDTTLTISITSVDSSSTALSSWTNSSWANTTIVDVY